MKSVIVMTMKKVIIVGSPGSGKSTFAAKLHDKTGLPLIHLDFYYHQMKYSYYNDRAAWVARVLLLMETDKWIMDGNYKSTILMRCETADTIILFDLPRWLCVYRVLTRRFHYRNKQRPDMPKEWSEKLTYEFIRYVWKFSKEQIPTVLEGIAANTDKQILIFHKQADVDAYLVKFE